MNRATGHASARATDRLIGSRKCSCHDSLALERRIFDAKSYMVAAIVRLAEDASSPVSSAGLALADVRRALSVLDGGDDE